MVIALALVASIVRLPYYVLSPGSATGVEPLIKVTGAQSYQHPGRILFTTVSLAGDVNAYSLLHGWLSDDEEVVSREEITGGTPQKTYEQQNVQAMTDSKTAATKVALERLGFTVPEHGSGAQVIQLVAQSPADGKLAVGDVITAVDGHPITLDHELVSAVKAHKPGDVISFTFTRGAAAPQ
ncbi:MAG TPA: PDZ domain-containing protein, partial [Acidimicrobiia bacterium]|nr:PDZ domain-containing protein [Acidimicrobiia bacterium]